MDRWNYTVWVVVILLIISGVVRANEWVVVVVVVVWFFGFGNGVDMLKTVYFISPRTTTIPISFNGDIPFFLSFSLSLSFLIMHEYLSILT